jgi:hypothetical protein
VIAVDISNALSVGRLHAFQHCAHGSGVLFCGTLGYAESCLRAFCKFICFFRAFSNVTSITFWTSANRKQGRCQLLQRQHSFNDRARRKAMPTAEMVCMAIFLIDDIPERNVLMSILVSNFKLPS